MSDALILTVVGAVINGAVTWGVVSTKLAWMRRDIDDLRAALTKLQERHT